MSNFQFSNSQIIPNHQHQLQIQRKPLKVAKCSAESFQFLSKKTKRNPVHIPLFLKDASSEDLSQIKISKNDSYESMMEATKQFFAKNKSSSTLQKVEKCKLEISSEISISHLKTSGDNGMCKKINQQEYNYNYTSSSPTQKDMDLWLTSQSMIPTIEENGLLLNESIPEIECMINKHIKNEFKSALCFDMPQEIFYDLE